MNKYFKKIFTALVTVLGLLVFTGCSLFFQNEQTSEKYKFIFSVDGANGSLSAVVDGKVITSGTEVENGKTVIFTATPVNGYTVKGWTLDGAAVNDTNTVYSLKVTKSATVSVSFCESRKYTVSFSSSENGSINAVVDGKVITSGTEVENGKKVVFTATANIGYEALDWLLNGQSTYTENDACEVIVEKNISLHVIFAEKRDSYKITFTTEKSIGDKIAISIRPYSWDTVKDKLWIDLNNNGKKDEDEQIASDDKADYIIKSQTISIYSGYRIYSFDCSKNEITSLNLEECPNLINLNCKENQLVHLDITNNPIIKYLYCSQNKLTNLDATNCPTLETLVCRSNQLTNLDITKCPALNVLYCDYNQLTNLDITKCPALNDLYCGANQLTNLDVTNCSNLTYLECEHNQLTNLDITKCPALKYLDFGGNQLANLDVTKCPALEVLIGDVNQLTSLDVTKCPALERLYCSSNHLTSLDITKCPALNDLYCGGNQLTNLDVTNCSNLTYLECEHNQITGILAITSVKLYSLKCSYNKITELTFPASGCPKLEVLHFDCNAIKNINLSNCVKLRDIYCHNNLLESLDFSDCHELVFCLCRLNKIKSIKLNCPKLVRLSINNNCISEDEMAKLVDYLRVLPAKMEGDDGAFLLYNHHGATDDETTGLIYEENNKYTNELVEKAKQKNWRVFTGFCMHSHPTEI